MLFRSADSSGLAASALSGVEELGAIDADSASVAQAGPEVSAVQAVSAAQASVVLAALKQEAPSVPLAKKTFSAKSKKPSRSLAEDGSPKVPRFAATSVQSGQKPVIWQKSSVKREKRF